MSREQSEAGNGDFDAVVIGAGFAGIYMLHRLSESGFRVHGFESGGDVGGTWYWNRYPGARCDSEAMYYSFSFLPEFEQKWPLENRYPTQAVILRYLEAAADHLDLRRDFTFNARVDSVVYDDATERWTVRTTSGLEATATYVVTAVGGLSAPNVPHYPGIERFAGEQHHTAFWPREPVSFAGKQIGLFGTGSSGVQILPEIAKEAAHVTVFQRTPQFVAPARQGPLDRQFVQLWKDNYQEMRRRAKNTPGGFPYPLSQVSAMELSPQERVRVCEEAWRRGGIWFLLGTFNDVLVNAESNKVVADFVRAKIDEIVHDPETAEKLKPKTYPFGTKRVPMSTDYYETYNRANVSLVDLRSDPIEEVTSTGIRTRSGDHPLGDHPLDIIVYATGFDALTGSLLALNIRGRGGKTLEEAWSDGPRTHLGLMVPNFPNLFTITGPGSPSVLTNVPTAIEQHVEWINDCIYHVRNKGFASIEATPEATAAWSEHVQEVANATLYPLADSWYLGANIAGKQRLFLPYVGGLDVYGEKCREVAASGYEGFSLNVHEKAGHGVG